MADPQFRTLLQEYTDELANPATRAEHEAYLREVEQRAKDDVGAEGGEYSSPAGSISIPKGSKLISPTPIFCVKVTVPSDAPRAKPLPRGAMPSGVTKFFINMCTCDALNDINNNQVEKGSTNGKGVQVSLPYSLSPLRPCKDTAGGDAGAYDFVFSASTWSAYQHIPRYVQLFTEMAVEAIEEREGFKQGTVDKNNNVIRLRNATFKGGKPPPRLFKLSEDKLAKAQQDAAAAAGTKKTTTTTEESKTQSNTNNRGADLKQVSSKALPKPSSAPAAETPKETRKTPSFQLVHRGFYDMTSNMLGGVSVESTTLSELVASRPKQLVLKISLPELQKISEVNLDQSATQVLLSSAQYFLLVPLPYPVLSEQGAAAWSNKTKTLTVTMDVSPPTQEEIDRYEAQKEPIRKAQQDRENKRKEEELKEEQERIQNERKEKEKQEEEEKRAADKAAAAATAAVATSTSPDSPSSSSPSTSPNSTTRSNHGRRNSALKTSSSSSPSSSQHHVRFDLAEQLADGNEIPERDGPHGPKPVGLLDDSSAASVAAEHHHKGKGHRKKHVPGAEGPPTWTGVGQEPERRIKEAFPADRAGPLSPNSVPASPQIKPSASPKLGAAASPTGTGLLHGGRLWPTFTYNQSNVNVQLVIKVKGIIPESIQFFLEDVPSSSAGGAAGSADSSLLDVYFSTAAPSKRHYRLFLPLSHAVNIPRSNYVASPHNLLINLMKKPIPASATTGALINTISAQTQANEWEHLANWSQIGVEVENGTSPAASPASAMREAKVAAAAGLPPIEELTLGEAHSNSSHLVQDIDESESVPADAPATPEPTPVAPLQPLPAITGSSMLNPFITNTDTASSTVTGAFSAPSNSLLFQLD